MRGQWRTLIMGLSLVVLSKIPQMALPKVLQLSIDHLGTGTAPDLLTRIAGAVGFTLGGTTDALIVYAFVYVGLAFIYGLGAFWSRWTVVSASRRIEYHIRNTLFDRLASLPASWFHSQRSGDIISRSTNDMDAVRMLLGPALMYTVNSLSSFLLALGLLLSISPELTLAGLAPFPILMGLVTIIGKLVHKRFLQIQEKLGGLSARIQENLNGIRVVKAYAREEREISSFAQINDDFVRTNEKLIRVQSAFFPMMMSLAGIGMVVVLWYGGNLVIRGEMTLGELVQFMAYIGMLTWPTIAAGWVVNLFQRGSAALSRIDEVLKTEPAIADSEQTRTDATITGGAISIRDLDFAYGDTPVLHDINVEIASGGTLGIVGPTGCGKTTLASLVPRLLEAPENSVSVDGESVRTISLTHLRGSIGVVPQDSFLFSDTIAANIRFGNPDARDEDVERVARIASLDEEVTAFANGWDTLVGERGLTLSGGQKQRVAIARALLRDPRILIMDDSLSAVDTQTESRILSALQSEIRDRTTIIIAHRLSAVEHADHVIYLDDGHIIEQGTHDELVALDGRYAELHRRQLLEEELRAA
jgi:ATP-binding cassette, subfamily B, multidrug efflux pump